jgi:hypothetical protein
MDYQKKYLKYKQKYLELKYQMGGYQTFDEIIAELKQKGKYDEWVAKGSFFGIRTTNMGINTSIYYYTNINNEKISVGLISNKYEEGLYNVPIFNFITKEKGRNEPYLDDPKFH